MITGDNMPFDTTGHGKKLSDVSTASNKTILVTEQTITACWMSPAFDLSLEDAIAGIGQKTLADIKRIRSRHPSDGANAGLMNGSVFFIREIDLSSYVLLTPKIVNSCQED